jgi:hypothetical protein
MHAAFFPAAQRVGQFGIVAIRRSEEMRTDQKHDNVGILKLSVDARMPIAPGSEFAIVPASDEVSSPKDV